MESENDIFQSFLPVYSAIPENWDDARPFIVEQFKRIANSVNFKEIGFFIDEEVLSGKAFIPGISTGYTSQTFRQVLRKVIDFGMLPDTTTKNVPHEIDIDGNFTLISLTACATDPVAFVSIPIPYVDTVALANQIEIDIDATNINITTGSNRNNFTRCYVILEYLQEL